MTIVRTYEPTDSRLVDLNEIFESATDWRLITDVNVTIRGVTYEDAFELDLNVLGTEFSLVYLGSNLSIITDADNQITSASGTIEFFETSELIGAEWNVVQQVYGFETDANDFLAAHLSDNISDDLEIVRDWFSKSDEIHLSDGEDYFAGLAGKDTIYGNDGNDTLVGNGGRDLLIGNAGNDTLYGGAGNDFLKGSAGNDVIYGGSGQDRVKGGQGHDTVYGGAGNDLLRGSKGYDDISGGGGDDRVLGGAGSDTLNGGAGDDHLYGGAKADWFVFNTNFGNDTIHDFSATNSAEKIDLSGVAAITGMSDLLSNHLAQEGDNAIITAGSNSITLLNVDIGELSSGDFIF